MKKISKRTILLVFAAALVILGILALIFRQQARDLVLLVTFIVWSINALLAATPQMIFWILLLGVTALMALRALYDISTPVGPAPTGELMYPRRERVDFWLIQIQMVRRSDSARRYTNFSRARFAEFLRKLTIQTLALRNHISEDEASDLYRAEELEIPPEVLECLKGKPLPPRHKASLRELFENVLSQKEPDDKASQSAATGDDRVAAFDHELETVIQYLEDTLEIKNEP